MDFGYARVSTKEQNSARQREVLEKTCNKYFEDKMSGRDMNRPQFKEMLSQVRKGDTIKVVSIDRLGRNMKELIDVALNLKEMGVNIVSVSQGIDTNTKVGEMFFMFMSLFAQMELDFIHERQAAGIEVAKREGRFMGRPKKELVEFRQYLKEVDSGQLTVDRACKLLGVSRSTFYRRKEHIQNDTISDDTEIDF